MYSKVATAWQRGLLISASVTAAGISLALGLGFLFCLQTTEGAFEERKEAVDEGISRVEPLEFRGAETFTIDSTVMGEVRRINVYQPTVYGVAIDSPMVPLLLLDGGFDEDFLHIAGLVQVLVSNGSIRPCLLVGIENTQRRRDMTGPTESEEDKKIAPVVGGSEKFREFIAEELMPAIREKYATSEQAAIIGESLAGWFVVETYFEKPEMFDIYVAIDPSLWWNSEDLLHRAQAEPAQAQLGTVLVLANSGEPTMSKHAETFAHGLLRHREDGVGFRRLELKEETHATVFHPAALAALRSALGKPAE